ncbi:MAG: tetratricopeptide repeat protein [Phycisphaerales bacterium]|nr:tetratricopeptide repeat protein [Phycisphaerales bacterium]
MRCTPLLVCCAMLLPWSGCAAPPRSSPYAPGSEGRRDTAAAQRLNQDAARVLRSDPERAERLLRQALTADLYFGPAHNNLGVVYLGRGMLYEAAGEFEWARRLMPGHPDPRMNLAITLERAGRIDDALTEYAAALEAYPGHVQTMQALVRCQLRHGRRDGRTPGFLEEVSMRGTTPEWREWARAALAIRGSEVPP